MRDVLNMIESRMLMQFANSFMTLGWRPSYIGDLNVFSVLKDKKGYGFVSYT